jgi:ubiquitin C-terminal hydrolase
MLKITGLQNMGNTCFINSSLQLLFNCPLLLQKICNSKNDNLKKYSQTIKDYFQESTNTLGPYILYKRYQKLNKNYFGISQEDAHEYLTFIIDDIDELGKDINIKDYFEISLISEVKCEECNNSSKLKISEKILSLSIDNCESLIDSFNKLYHKEILDNDNKWFCDKCNKKVLSSKKIYIDNLSKYLIICLNRFIFNGNNIIKNNNNISFPKIIFNNYFLRGIIYHIGNINGGHYICSISRNGEDWVLIDDTNIIEEITFEKLENINNNAYILLYHKN